LNSPSGLLFPHFRNKSSQKIIIRISLKLALRPPPAKVGDLLRARRLGTRRGCFAISTKEDEWVVCVFWHGQDGALDRYTANKHALLCTGMGNTVKTTKKKNHTGSE
jgi:hypothetical protein